MALPTCASAVRLRHQHCARVLLLLDLPRQYLRQLPLTLCLCFICHVIIRFLKLPNCHVIILYSACHCFFCVSLEKKKLLKKLPKEIKKLPAAEKLSKIEIVIQNVLLTSAQPLLTIYPFFDA